MAIEDKDLLSIQQARSFAARAKKAAEALKELTQEQVDRIVDAMAEAARAEAERLARLAHEETGFGNTKDKTTKNLFSAVDVYGYIRPLRTVGILREDAQTRVVEIAEPMGVVAAVIPSTDPTSTAIFKALICDEAIKDQVIAETRKNGGHFLNEAEVAALSRVVVTPQRLANPEIVGKPAPYIAEKAGIKVPPETRALVAPLAGVGRDFPLSIEKLSPVLAFYVVKDWHEGCERCLQLLRYGGTGHTLGIHSRDDAVIREFALKKPVYRIIANSQTSMGATGYTTGLAPSMSLGCGAYAGNVTSDNITPLHLINIKRLAYELPRDRRGRAGAGSGTLSPLRDQVAAFVDQRLGSSSPVPALPAAPAAAPPL